MTLLMLLEMVASAFGDRLAIGTAAGGLTYQQLLDRAGAGRRGAPPVRGRGTWPSWRGAMPASRWRSSPRRGPGCRSCR